MTVRATRLPAVEAADIVTVPPNKWLLALRIEVDEL
jgi:hypothetical protein